MCFCADSRKRGPPNSCGNCTVSTLCPPPSPPHSPQAMIDFTMKRMCGILLSRLQASAHKVLKDPVGNAHARRMREDVTFYR